MKSDQKLSDGEASKRKSVGPSSNKKTKCHQLQLKGDRYQCLQCLRSVIKAHKFKLDNDSMPCLQRPESPKHAQIRRKSLLKVAWAKAQLGQCCAGKIGSDVVCSEAW